MGKKSSSPPAPDYRGAAEATADSQRVDQITPYGELRWGDYFMPNGERRWQTNITLDPRVQQTLDTQMDMSNQMSNLALDQVGRVEDFYSRPMDLSSVPEIADRAYGSFTARLDPRFAREEDQLRTRLTNQGLTAGGEAFDNEMRNFNQGRNDAYQRANLAAIETMPQTYQLESAAYQQPLNIFNALRSGSQVQNPQFQSMGPGTDYMSAAQGQGMFDIGQHNADVAQQNQTTSGLYGLAAAGIMAFAL